MVWLYVYYIVWWLWQIGIRLTAAARFHKRALPQHLTSWDSFSFYSSFFNPFSCFNPIPIPLSWPFLVPLLTHFLVILLWRLQTSQLSRSKNLTSFPFSGSQLAFLNEWGALWLFDADTNSSRELADNSSFVSGSSKKVLTFD